MAGRQDNPWLTLAPRDGGRRVVHQISAVAETLFVLLGMVVLARILFNALGLASSDSFLFPDDGPADFGAAAVAEGQWHAMRYGLIFGVIIIIGVIRSRTALQSYGLGRSRHSLGDLILFGFGLFAVMHIPALGLRIVDHFVDIGPGTPFWSLMETADWDRDFWLYMAVSSFLIVPIVEEIVARGYILGRFREDFSAGGALLMMAILFAGAHTQYHQTDFYALGSLFALVWGSLLMGYAVYRTGSLLPAIIAHGLVNIPTILTVDFAIATLIILTLMIWRRLYLDQARQLLAVFGTAREWPGLMAGAVLVIALVTTLTTTPWAPHAWLAVLVTLFTLSLMTKSAWSGAKPDGADDA